ncbi:hypothetical protein ACFV06_41380, partial [Streptomyces sp. NPDC059618]|uniref:hypothetical protein n=1 Tax=Streptomyces sp. NPDC059618 TaxID=3346887 RepID=UPI0036C31F4F
MLWILLRRERLLRRLLCVRRLMLPVEGLLRCVRRLVARRELERLCRGVVGLLWRLLLVRREGCRRGLIGRLLVLRLSGAGLVRLLWCLRCLIRRLVRRAGRHG